MSVGGRERRKKGSDAHLAQRHEDVLVEHVADEGAGAVVVGAPVLEHQDLARGKEKGWCA